MVDVITMTDLWKKDIDGYLPVLLEVYNPDIVWSQEEKESYGQEDSYLRLINDTNKVIYKGKTYLPCAFDFTAPEVDGKKVGNASITISALDSRVKKLLRTIKIPSDVRVVSMFVKVNKPSEMGGFVYRFAELNSVPFRMETASSNKTSATFNLIFNKNFTQNVPYDVATPNRVPGTLG